MAYYKCIVGHVRIKKPGRHPNVVIRYKYQETLSWESVSRRFSLEEKEG